MTQCIRQSVIYNYFFGKLKFMRSNEPCSDELNVPAGFLHTDRHIQAKIHAENSATTRKCKLVSVGMAASFPPFRANLLLLSYHKQHFYSLVGHLTPSLSYSSNTFLILVGQRSSLHLSCSINLLAKHYF